MLTLPPFKPTTNDITTQMDQPCELERTNMTVPADSPYPHALTTTSTQTKEDFHQTYSPVRRRYCRAQGHCG